MKSKLLIPIFVMVLLAFTVNAFVISGTVTDTSLVPINGAQIDVYDSSSVLVNSTTTNATGDYSLEVGNLLRVVNASAAGYDPQSTPVFVSADTTVNFALGPIQSVTLAGYVTNSTDPLNNADVVIKQGGATFTQTVTDALGYYSVSVIDGDSYDVTASLTGYDSETSPVTISGATAQDFELTLTPPACTDNDGDGYGLGCALGPDFDDNNASLYPGASCSRSCYSGSTYDTSGTCTGGSYTCGGGGSCFPAGTKILMADNTNKDIEDIEVGDKVMGFDGNNKVSVEVLELESPVRDHMYTLTFEDGSELELTREHPLYTEQGWKSLSPEATADENAELKVQELTIGDKVLNSEGNYVEITNIDFVKKIVQTYNLKKVSEYNNFFADGFLAHNKGSTYSGTDYKMDLDEGETITKELRRKDTMAFDYEDEEHTITLTGLTNTRATIKVESTPIIATLNILQTKGFNLDGDLANDLFITLKDITGGEAELEFKLAESLIIPDLPIAPPTPEPEYIQDVPQQSGNPITIIVEDEDVIIEDDDESNQVTSAFIQIKDFFKNTLDKILYLKYIVAGVIFLAVLILVISLITRLKSVKKAAKKSKKKEEISQKIKDLEIQLKDLKNSV